MRTTSKRPSSSKHSSRKSRWESESAKTKNPSPSKSNNPKKEGNPQKDLPSSSIAAPSLAAPPGGPSHFPAVPPPPIYGFQNLERRTIVLADGSARTYLALPPDYPLEPLGHQRFGFDRLNASPDRFRPGAGIRMDFGPGAGTHRDLWMDGQPREMVGPSGMKRKFGEEDEFAWHRQHVSQYGSNPDSNNVALERSPARRKVDSSPARKVDSPVRRKVDSPPRRKTDSQAGVVDVDPQLLKRAFLNFVKVINENANHKKVYLEDGKGGVAVNCIICRASFPDVHGLIMHLYTAQKPDQRVDHLGLHKALCVLMGWNHVKAPDESKAYQSLSADEASANREDLIVWPPTVVIRNTSTGKKKDGLMDGMGNREIDTKLKDLGFAGGKAKSLYGKEGHSGITVAKFASTLAGLKEAERLAEYFEKGNNGRKSWEKAIQHGLNDEKNPALIKDKERVLYGYLATAFDLDIFDPDMKKKAVVKSRKELDL